MPGFGCSKSEPVPEPTAVPCNVGSCLCFLCSGKICTKATNLLKFCMVGSDGLDLALGAGAAGFGFAAGVGNMYTGSGLFWGWAVAL